VDWENLHPLILIINSVDKKKDSHWGPKFKDYTVKGIVSLDWKGLQMFLLDRFEV
jgi:hypothetical protein